MSQRPQFFGRVHDANRADGDKGAALVIELDDGRRIVIPTTDEQLQGFWFEQPVRMVVHPTTDKTVAKLKAEAGE